MAASNLLAQKAELPVKETWLQDRRDAQRAGLQQQQQHQSHAAGGGPRAALSLASATSSSNPNGALVHSAAGGRSGAAANRRLVDVDGEAAPMDVDLFGTREGTLLAAIDQANVQAKQEHKVVGATTTIQSAARMFLDRRRFVLHRTQVKAQIAAIVAQRNMRCAITVQRCARGLACRLRYRRQREEEALAALEASKSKAAKGGRGAKAGAGAGKGGAASPNGGGGLNALLSPQELALQQNANFVKGTRAYLSNNLEEAIAALELQQRAKPEPVTSAFLEMVKRKRSGHLGASSPGLGTSSSGAAALSSSTNGQAKKGGAKAGAKKK